MYKTESFKPDTFKPAVLSRMEKLHCQEKKFHIIQFAKTMSSMDQMEIQSHRFLRMPIFRSDVEDTANRPVVFAYNGGPGSSCMYVHAGFLRNASYSSDDEVVS